MDYAKLIEKLLPLFLSRISNELREAIIRAVLDLEKRAKKTSNKFDDFLVDVLKAILDIPEMEPKKETPEPESENSKKKA